MARSDEQTIELEFDGGKLSSLPAAERVERMSLRQRNRICLRIIFIGLLNFLLYTVTYAAIGGDAPNGHREAVVQPDGTTTSEFYVRGHFIRSLDGKERKVPRSLWIYSYLHSITLPLTSGAMIVSMLVLARPHILATMRDSWISGRTFVTAFATLAIAISLLAAFIFSWELAAELLREAQQ